MANVGLVYYLTDSMGGEWEFSGQYTYRGEFYARAFNSSQRDNVPSYGMTNLNVTYFTPQKSWKIDLNVHNLFDEDAVITRFTDTFGLGFSSDQYLAPRTVTLRAKYFF
jgi:iron complex outermembrane receptor protein